MASSSSAAAKTTTIASFVAISCLLLVQNCLGFQSTTNAKQRRRHPYSLAKTSFRRPSASALHVIPPVVPEFDSSFIIETASNMLADAADAAASNADVVAAGGSSTASASASGAVSAAFQQGPPETAGISYSRASYYAVLGLYLMSFPGVWSQVKRSTKAKIKRKTYVSAGENKKGGGKSLREEAGEIMACTYSMGLFFGNHFHFHRSD